MFDLSTIRKMNDAACAVRVEDNHNRHCSWTGDYDGVVLHSAKFRNTVFLKARQATKFIDKMRTLSGQPDAADRIIESYFKGGAV